MASTSRASIPLPPLPLTVGLRNVVIVLANACGPRFGQWDGRDLKKDKNFTIIPSHNRYFTKADGKLFKLEVPCGYDHVNHSFQPPLEDLTSIKVAVEPKSNCAQRLQLWTGAPTDLPILMNIEGKYTTNHVPAGGPENRVIGAISFENNEANNVKNQIAGECGGIPNPQTAAYYIP
ncbi:hypothetical protein H1R20_g10657, partial [Candolleomyces eurysporus]